MIYLPSLILTLAALVRGQSAPELQTTGWNSSFKLSPGQLKLGNLSNVQGDLVNIIINFDRTLLANGGAHEDDFYTVPRLSGRAVPTQPGKVLKVQKLTDPKPFSIPSKTALSRIMYTTQNVNGTLIPASAYILWPYEPKKFGGKKSTTAPVVLWTHGTSGFYPNGAPSTHRGLFYADIVPFALAQAGYAVVAPDYAGLGVGTSWDGTRVPHQYFASQAGAGDALNALRATQDAFPNLSRDYVVMGHSQGGAIAWWVSQLLKDKKFKDVERNHLGTVVAAPPTSDALAFTPEIFLPWIGKDLDQIYTEFNLSDWLTPLGVARTELLNQVEGSQMVSTFLFEPQEAVVNPDWDKTWFIEAFKQLANPGKKPYKGPMLVLQGTEDPAVRYNTTVALVKDTCREYPGDLELLTVPGAGHFPTIDASRQTWLQWIEDRFEGRHVKNGCVRSELSSFLPVDHYQLTPNSFPQWAGAPQFYYELPTGA